MTVGEIRDRFNLDTIGDAWVMVLENDWPHRQNVWPDRPNTWAVEVPDDET